MIVHLDTPQPLDECARQLGGLQVEQLFTPLTPASISAMTRTPVRSRKL
jgi:hypothetical protein